MTWQSGDVQLDGVRIHYYRRGSGPPIVFAHGAGDNGMCWERVAQRLEADHDVIAYDARCHGLTQETAESPGSGTSDLIGLVEGLGLQRPAVMGHSMGAGSASAALASRPELFRCGILEDPGFRSANAAPIVRSGPPQAMPPQDLSSFTYEQMLERGRGMYPKWHPDELPAWARSKLQRRTPPQRPQGDGAPAARPRWQDAVAAYRCPVLLVCAGERALVDPEAEAEAKRINRLLESVRFPESGHNIRREAFEGFVEAVTAFLARHR